MTVLENQERENYIDDLYEASIQIQYVNNKK
jgi:hypothetical protein